MNRRILLEKHFGIPIWFEKNKLFSGGEYEVLKESDILLSEVSSQTINSELMYPEVLGSRYLFNFSEAMLSPTQNLVKNEIITLAGTLLGIEYAKLGGTRTVSKHATLIQVMYGAAFIVIHNSFFDEKDFIFKSGPIYIVKVKAGQSFIVPANTGYTIVNAQLSLLIVHKVLAKEAVEEPVFDNHKGAAYYVIYKNSKPEKVINPYFRELTKAKEIPSSKLAATCCGTCLSIPEIFDCLMCKELDEKLRFVLGVDEFPIDELF